LSTQIQSLLMNTTDYFHEKWYSRILNDKSTRKCKEFVIVYTSIVSIEAPFWRRQIANLSPNIAILSSGKVDRSLPTIMSPHFHSETSSVFKECWTLLEKEHLRICNKSVTKRYHHISGKGRSFDNNENWKYTMPDSVELK
jgi:hypothetical protein